MLDVGSIRAPTGMLSRLLHLLGMVEQPTRVLAVLSSRLSTFIQQQAFFGDDALQYRATMC